MDLQPSESTLRSAAQQQGDSHLYIVNKTPNLTKDIVLATAQNYIGSLGGVEVSLQDGGQAYIVTTRAILNAEEQVELNEFCQLQAKWFPDGHELPLRRKPLSSLDSHHTPSSSDGHTSSNTLTRQQKLLTNTYRIQYLRSLTPDASSAKQRLEEYLKHQLSIDKVEVLSNCPSSHDRNCATFVVDVDKLPSAHIKEAQIDDNFLGITPLYDPGLGDAVMDIFVVPGLGTRAIRTFRPRDKETGQEQRDIWLRDFLPGDLPGCRVLLYGYDSTVVKSHSTAVAKDYAEAMMNELSMFREGTKTQDRPIIYLGHSLGGILVKQMLCSCHEYVKKGQGTAHTSFGADIGAEQLGLYRHCKGIMFFGVPNLGLNNGAIHEMSQNQPNQELVRSVLLSKNGGQVPRYLSDLDDEFRDAIADLKSMSVNKSAGVGLACFYEDRFTPTAMFQSDIGKWQAKVGDPILMVSKHSASLLQLQQQARRFERDHSDLVKFATKYDLDYQTVVKELRKWVEPSIKSGKKQRGKGH